MRATQREALFFLLSVEEDFSIFSFPRGWEQHEELFFLLSVVEDFSILERELLESIRYRFKRQRMKKRRKKNVCFWLSSLTESFWMKSKLSTFSRKTLNREVERQEIIRSGRDIFGRKLYANPGEDNYPPSRIKTVFFALVAAIDSPSERLRHPLFNQFFIFIDPTFTQ